MANLKRRDDIKVAVTVDDKPHITSDEGVVYEAIEDHQAYLFIKTKDESKNIKIKLFK
ncbi:MAG: hypothetical protein ACOC1K_05860 [Nanoarchaeota archaeon]